ncbi:beta-ketoacyl synthase N-terminal-like domain-containing protein [Amycolatopsis regifaucium]|uniref:3-oxoacyl-ACP synthase n=1 Tax=Amycolatopsis regifaucium TaxID=546365 RepID=A0A154MRB3_9PSEU|nr:beta-ketoacyl synthase N-terminal-like domain-containing protein [Amycolatopsis regifaucium]KZB86871.1 3-oxoacyl-ACP synthase [Amycolatopsis regifaucium]OKA09302.1 3-oxoacyl-ACP synthase [Amycolatopsis regifaucium]SFH57938.1 3-oxoacyl-[acyl-carrier-protein] synthase II [Amycolatopsis regifaucium]
MRSKTGICGIGAVTAYGWGRESLWEGLVSGLPAAQLVEGFGETRELPGWVGHIPEGGRPRDGSLHCRALLAAAREAIEDAGAHGWTPGRRVGLVYGGVRDDMRTWDGFHALGERLAYRRQFIGMMPSTPITSLMAEFGFHGPTMTASAMCATGNAAVLTAKMWLDAGMADDVVVVTTDLSATRQVVRHFVHCGVAVTDVPPLEACRPFQEGTRGFTFSEASIAVVMTQRKTDAYATVLGGAMTHEAHNAMALDPDPTTAIAAVTGALENANADAADVRYVNAHGTGTKLCHRTESQILEAVFPRSTEIYSIKPLTGHSQSGSALTEIVTTCLAARRDLIPAPKPVADGHPQLMDGPSRPESGLTVKTSIGMGGYVTAVVLDAA